MPRRKDLRRKQRDEARAILLEAAKSGDKPKAKTAILAARLMESIDSEFVQEGWRERATAAETRVEALEREVKQLSDQLELLTLTPGEQKQWEQNLKHIEDMEKFNGKPYTEAERDKMLWKYIEHRKPVFIKKPAAEAEPKRITDAFGRFIGYK